MVYWEWLKQQREQSEACDFPFWPFVDAAEWSLAHFLITSGLSKAKIDQFLKLQWVRSLKLYQ
jgi:hypothetical protein